MLYALFTMVLLTLGVGCIALKSRVGSVNNKSLSIKYFQVMQGDNIPLSVMKSSRCFNNMFEIPVLFYVVGSLYISLNIDSSFAIICAWLFVIARCIQATVHLTYNNVIHRMLAFWLSTACVLALWINLLVQQM